MYEHKGSADPAYSLLLVNVLEQMLQQGGHPDQVAHALNVQIREITGARLVILLQAEERCEQPRFIIHPESRRGIAESIEARELYKVTMQTDSIMLWDKSSQDPVGNRLLSAWQMNNCLSVPLFVGAVRVGTLVIMDFSFTGNIDSLISTMDRMSGVIGLIIRNADLYREVERLVEARTQEINERKKIEEELKDAKQQAELYLDLMSHDIRNMNQVGIGFLELALDSPDIIQADKELLSKSMGSLEASTHLIDNVKKLQKVRSGELRNYKINACLVIKRILARYSMIPDINVRFECRIPPSCHVMANDLIGEVFENILWNAIKYCGPQPVIRIEFEEVSVRSKSYDMISIEDNGPGIPDNVKDRIFRRLQRGDTRVRGGGMGLYLVKSLVESYDGRVWVEDRVPGDYTKGSRFIIMLPLAEQ
ncbi:hypothetical protein CUJ83_12305 [Methanocella sp. CWC-04]|uniref:histidine kinase n=1 Tax=Methanooceanicella nereidis TaxID=2052831 RepID=A0AAP2W873_9EURY|nr:HAMP domain-containing sensor histidine kinase [Methanocella sp. CWC-04]MCD1295781.1 hypothetical protein [Methanocella sp. CWC-04]